MRKCNTESRGEVGLSINVVGGGFRAVCKKVGEWVVCKALVQYSMKRRVCN